jgi:hypothetical protein
LIEAIQLLIFDIIGAVQGRTERRGRWRRRGTGRGMERDGMK